MFSKKIVAAAALLAMAVGAQAQVKIYGQLDMSVGSFDTFTSKKSVTRVESGVMSTGSYIGFAGSEDLGGGLKAHFVLESFIAADTGGTVNNRANGFWGRASNVALSGGFGKVTLGQADTPFYTALTNYSPFGDSQVFSPAQVAHFGSTLLGLPTGTLGYDTGWTNSVTYDTPNLSGLSATVQYAPKENNAAGADNKNNVGFAVSYNAGPLSASFVNTNTGDNGNQYSDRQKNNAFGASYDFGIAKVSGLYTTVKSGSAAPFTKFKFYQIGAEVPVTAAGKLLVAYGQVKVDNTNPTQKARMFSVGYDHTLSKRTSVYVAANSLKINPTTAVVNASPDNFAVGIKHNF